MHHDVAGEQDGVGEAVLVNAGVVAGVVQVPDQFLGGDVAVRPGGERAAAVSAECGVKTDDAGVHRCARRRQRLAVGVVEVEVVGQVRFGVADVLQAGHHLVGGRGAQGVREPDVGDAHVLEGADHAQQVAGVDARPRRGR